MRLGSQTRKLPNLSSFKLKYWRLFSQCGVEIFEECSSNNSGSGVFFHFCQTRFTRRRFSVERGVPNFFFSTELFRPSDKSPIFPDLRKCKSDAKGTFYFRSYLFFIKNKKWDVAAAPKLERPRRLIQI